MEEDCPDQNNDVYLDVSNLASVINRQRGTSGDGPSLFFKNSERGKWKMGITMYF